MKNLIHYLALVVAIVISSVAGFFSVVGLEAIYSGASHWILLMGASIELGKVVTASWIYRNWKISPWFIKGALTTAVIVLMCITSMGVFGYLSKAHLAHMSLNANPTLEISALQTQIDSEKRNISNAQRALDSLDKIVDTASTKEVVYIRNRQTKERAALNQTITDAGQHIVDLTNKQLPLQQQTAQVEADLGPLKYIADAVYGEEEAPKHIDQTVRYVTIAIVSVFDPLAICLLIAANIGLAAKQEEKQAKIEEPPLEEVSADWIDSLRPRKRRGVIEIDESSVKQM